MLKKVRVDELRLGMHLQSLDGPYLDHPFWKTRFVLRDPADLVKLQASGIGGCWIDVSKGLDVATPLDDRPRPATGAPAARDRARPPFTDPRAPAATPPRAEFAEELQRAATLINQSKQAVTALFAEARMGKALDTRACTELVEDVTSSIWRNPGALLSLARLKTHDDYTYMHSVAVCTLMVALARQLDLGEDRAREAGMAGLLHDLGKAAMPLSVLTKPGKLSEEEFAVMRSHPERGHAMLSGPVADASVEAEWITEGVLDVCLHHHERIDGTGYPHRLQGEQISQLARMGAICDVYDAITSNRPYKAAWDPSESIGLMASWRKGQFDDDIFQAFVRSLGIYPVGSLVRMVSDRLGVVVEQNPDSITCPKVKVFFSVRTNLPVSLEVIDLASPKCTDRIAGRESNKAWKFPHLDSLWAGSEVLLRLGRG